MTPNANTAAITANQPNLISVTFERSNLAIKIITASIRQNIPKKIESASGTVALSQA